MDQKTISSDNDHPFQKHGVGEECTDTGKQGNGSLNLPSCPIMNHAGGCYCGNIRYLVNGQPVIHLYCFCEDCHSISGSDGYHSGYMVKESDFQLVSGTPATHEELSEEGRTIKRHYCRKCGCEIWAQTDLGLISVSASTFDDPTACHSAKKVFVHDAPDWARIPDESVRRQGLSSMDGPDDEDDTNLEFTAVDLVLEPEPQSEIVLDGEDDTDLEFTAVDLVLEPEPQSGIDHEDEDDTDLEFATVDLVLEAGPQREVTGDDEDDTDLDYESPGKNDRHSPVNFGYQPGAQTADKSLEG
ncbi:MAG: GFA family protein [Gammaproteobacteria bacterium]|nr:GFA family protein [Gammaproteobacteria bacterium]